MGKSYEKSNFLNLPVNILYPEHVLTLRLDSPSLTISAAEFDDAGPFSPISLAKFSIELNKSIKFFFKSTLASISGFSPTNQIHSEKEKISMQCIT